MCCGGAACHTQSAVGLPHVTHNVLWGCRTSHTMCCGGAVCHTQCAVGLPHVTHNVLWGCRMSHTMCCGGAVCHTQCAVGVPYVTHNVLWGCRMSHTMCCVGAACHTQHEMCVCEWAGKIVRCGCALLVFLCTCLTDQASAQCHFSSLLPFWSSVELAPLIFWPLAASTS